jgi:hypothetical protein
MKSCKKIAAALRAAFALIFAFTWIYTAYPQIFSFPQKIPRSRAAGWYDSGWAYRKNFTIEASEVLSTVSKCSQIAGWIGISCHFSQSSALLPSDKKLYVNCAAGSNTTESPVKLKKRKSNRDPTAK